MTDIPEDVMQKAEAAYLASLHDSMAGKPDFLKHVCLAILGEREQGEDLRDALRAIMLHGELACVSVDHGHLFSGGKKPATKEVWQFPRHLLARHLLTKIEAPVSKAKGESCD